MDEQIIERAVEAAAEADYRRCYPKGPGLNVDPDVKPSGFSDSVRPIVTTALAEVEASITAERDKLRRWKEEALPVLAGLQDLGRALDVPLGQRITGDVAAKRAEELRAAAALAGAERDELAAHPEGACDR